MSRFSSTLVEWVQWEVKAVEASRGVANKGEDWGGDRQGVELIGGK